MAAAAMKRVATYACSYRQCVVNTSMSDAWCIVRCSSVAHPTYYHPSSTSGTWVRSLTSSAPASSSSLCPPLLSLSSINRIVGVRHTSIRHLSRRTSTPSTTPINPKQSTTNTTAATDSKNSASTQPPPVESSSTEEAASSSSSKGGTYSRLASQIEEKLMRVMQNMGSSRGQFRRTVIAIFTTIAVLAGGVVLFRENIMSTTSSNLQEIASRTLEDKKLHDSTQEVVKSLLKDPRLLASSTDFLNGLLRQEQTRHMLVELVKSSLQDPVTLQATDTFVKALLKNLLADPATMQQLTTQVAQIMAQPETKAAVQSLLNNITNDPQTIAMLGKMSNELLIRVMEDPAIREKLITFAQSLLKDPRLHQQGGVAVWETIKNAFIPSLFAPEPAQQQSSRKQQQPQPTAAVKTEKTRSTTPVTPAKKVIPTTAVPTERKRDTSTPVTTTTVPQQQQQRSVSKTVITPPIPANVASMAVPPPIPHSNSMPPSLLLQPIHLPADDASMLATSTLPAAPVAHPSAISSPLSNATAATPAAAKAT